MTPRLIFRRSPSNRFSLPVLLHSLEREGILSSLGVQILEDSEAIDREASRGDFLLVAYGFMTPDLPWVWEEVKRLKARHPGRIIWIAGGPHPTGDPESALKMGFDLVVVGEGESLFPRLCTSFLETGGKLPFGIYRAESYVSLDESFPISRVSDLIPPLEIMRGCFYRCRFCQTGNHTPRHRSLESVSEFLAFLKSRRLRFRLGFICPSGFEYGADRPGRIDLDRIARLLALAKQAGVRHVEYGLFPSEVRPETVTPEGLRLIRTWCSNRKITIGGQTGSDPLMRHIRRGHDRDTVERAAAYIREAGLRPQIDIILGFPEETPEDRLETLAWMKRLHSRFQIRVHVHYFLPLAGTPYADALPTPLGRKIEALLETYHRAGICNDWWKKGKQLSQKIVETREALKRL